jgi:hypothetical protein
MRALRTLLAAGTLSFVAVSLHAQGAVRPVADPFVGSFSDGTGTVVFKKASKGYTGSFELQGQSFPVSAAKVGNRVIGTFEAGGNTYMFEAHAQGNGLAVSLNGQTFQLTRGDRALDQTGAAVPRSGAAEGSATGGADGGGAQDQQLAQLLLSSAWCSFSYKSGYTTQSRNQFHRDGTLSVSTGSEGGTVNQYGGGNVDIGGGSVGSVYGQQQGGGRVQWKVQSGQLYLNDGSGFQAVPIRVARNSNGYPIITAVNDGKEYSQCN